MKELKIANYYNPDADAIIFHGDTLDFINEIPRNSVKLIVTSPPYNMGKSYETNLDFDTYILEQEKVISECINRLSEDGSICWQVGNYVRDSEIIPLDIPLYPIFAKHNLKLRNRIVWHFEHGLHASKRFSGRYEVILWFTKSDTYTFNLDPVRIPQKYPQKRHFKGPKKGELSGNPLGKNPSDMWEIPNVKANHIEKTIHPCQFPVELIERLVLSLTNENDWVFDPFMGVGSSLIAAIIHNRRAMGSEILKEYVDIAIDRIRSAQNGTLKIRPMERPVYDPMGVNDYIPPKVVNLNMPVQQTLLEHGEEYKTKGEIDEKNL